jgi:superfamily II DNA/RNA helicase
MARGVDVPGVDLVVNLSPANDMNTHMHRVGRSGRYGGQGVAITMLGQCEEAEKMLNLLHAKSLEVKVLDVEKDFPFNLISNKEFHSQAIYFQQHPIISGPPDEELLNDLTELGIDDNPQTSAEVPARSSTRKAFYLRKEFFDIFASRTLDQWKEYARDNLDLLDTGCMVDGAQTHRELSKISAVNKSKNLPPLPTSRSDENHSQADTNDVEEELKIGEFRSIEQFRAMHDAMFDDLVKGT